MIAPETVGGLSHAAHPSLQTLRFPIAGMTCSSCVARVTRALRRLDGIAAVRVDLAAEVAFVRRDPAIATDAAIERAISADGYVADLGAAIHVDPAQTERFLTRLFRRP